MELTPEEKWAVGLLWADGGIGWNHGRTLTVRLNTVDRELVDQVSEIFGGKVRICAAPKGNRKQVYALDLRGQAADLLFDLGMAPRKSFRDDLPDMEIEENFVRGYFDGDGSVWVVSRTGRIATSFVGSHGVLEAIQNVVVDRAGVRRNRICPHGSIWRLMFNFRDSERLASFMYSDPLAPCLARKREVFGQ